MRKRKVKNTGPICDHNHNEEIITNDLQKAEHFNDFFVNINEDLTKQLDPLDFSSLNTFITRVTPTRDNTYMSWDLVKEKLMKAANPKKATGPDHVSPRDLSIIGDPVIHSLLPMFMKSVRDASFPSSWKLSRVSPIFKKGSPTDVNNYRPISLLSIPGKILEDVVCDTLNNHMDTQGLLCHKQWGFGKNYSTESLLLHLTETWRNALDKDLKVGVLFIDFRKAFDTVNHTILLEKLKAIGVSGDLLSWLDDYMSARKQLSNYQNISPSPKQLRIEFPKAQY